MADGAEAALDRVGVPDALPMPGREIEKSHQLFAILLQAQRGFWIFRIIGFDEQVKRLVRRFPCFGLPDVMQCLFGLGLGGFLLSFTVVSLSRVKLGEY